MDSTKQWWLSKGVWGAVIAGVATIGGVLWKIDITPAEQIDLVNNIVAFATAATAIVGAVLALVGRLKAKHTIGKPAADSQDSGDANAITPAPKGTPNA